MGTITKINWTARPDREGKMQPGATYNPWIGCTKVSQECRHCYAEAQDSRWGWTPAGWGHGKERHYTGESGVRTLQQLNRASRREGSRRAVFCGSLCDVFDPEVPDERRDELFEHIWCFDSLEWLLLTKRPEVAARYLATIRGWPWPHVRLGVSCGTAEAWARWLCLSEIPSFTRFCSMGPLLEFIPLNELLSGCRVKPDWIIAEGESCPVATRARPMAPEWVREIRDACWLHLIPFWFKQWGEWAPLSALEGQPQASGAIRGGAMVPRHDFGDEMVYCVGVKTAGRTLDHREHSGLPQSIRIDRPKGE